MLSGLSQVFASLCVVKQFVYALYSIVKTKWGIISLCSTVVKKYEPLFHKVTESAIFPYFMADFFQRLSLRK